MFKFYFSFPLRFIEIKRYKFVILGKKTNELLLTGTALLSYYLGNQ